MFCTQEGPSSHGTIQESAPSHGAVHNENRVTLSLHGALGANPPPPIIISTVVGMAKAIMIGNQTGVCDQELTPTTVPTTLETPRATYSISLTPTSSGRNLGPVHRTRSSRLSQSYSRMDQNYYSGRDHRWDKPHRSHSNHRSHSHHRDWDRHTHHRESRSSPQGRRDGLLSSCSSYEEYLDYFHRPGASNQGSLPTPEDGDSFSDTLWWWGRSYKDSQLLSRIPRHKRDSPILRTLSPSAALGAPPKDSSKCPQSLSSPGHTPPFPARFHDSNSRGRGAGRRGNECRRDASMTSRAPPQGLMLQTQRILQISPLIFPWPLQQRTFPSPLPFPHGKT